jgi:uncharacterized protein (TIGR02145 family)
MKPTSLWSAPNPGTDNLSDFTALPGGKRRVDGAFIALFLETFFWSATEFNPTVSWYRSLNYSNNDVNRLTDNKATGASVRCLKD